MKKLSITLLLLLAGCSHLDTVAERKNHALAQRCADGWFKGLEFTEHDKQLVQGALDDWMRVIEAAEGKK